VARQAEDDNAMPWEQVENLSENVDWQIKEWI
jgi:hypothetical protein